MNLGLTLTTMSYVPAGIAVSPGTFFSFCQVAHAVFERVAEILPVDVELADGVCVAQGDSFEL